MMGLMSKIVDNIPADSFTEAEIVNLTEGSANRRYGLIKRAIAKGELIHVRRGFYCLGQRYRRKPLNLFELAQKIYGPSYISFESALSFRGWILESVPTITSTTSKRARVFETPLGIFDYRRVSCSPLLTGVVRESQEEGTFLMAKPLKALADYVYLYKRDWKNSHPLIHSLRIEEDFLRKLKGEDFEELKAVYSSRRVLNFLKGLKRDLFS